MLAVSNSVAIPTNKDRRFALVRAEDVQSIQRELLACQWYRPLVSCNFEHMQRIAIAQYTRLVAAVAEIDDRVTVSLLCSSLS